MYEFNRAPLINDRNREHAKLICSTCGCPLDDLGPCPRCLLRKMDSAKMLRIKQHNQDLFREIDRIVAKAW